MDRTAWFKQTADKPLFPDMLWSRPETKRARGKLLVIGGNSQGFTAPAQAYAESASEGVGTTRVMLPDHVKKLLPSSFSEMEFAPGTPSGSFARLALAELLDAATWADGVLLAGDFGRNAETAILLEQFIQKYKGQLTLSQDSIDYFLTNAQQIVARPDTLIVPTFSQLQRLATSAKFKTPFTSKMDFLHFIEALQDFTKEYSAAIVVQHLETDFVAVSGRVSTIKPPSANNEITRSAHAAVWWLQNVAKTFEALTTSLV